jgi:hypothetical protein
MTHEDPELGVATRVRAFALFESIFAPGGEADTGLAADGQVAAKSQTF